MGPIGFTPPRPAQVRRLGHVLYAAGLRLQRALAAHVEGGQEPDQIVILEHNPVFTLGRNATRADIHVTDAFLQERGVGVFETDRGGQVTYHGPGQIVVYPICNLKGGREDVGRLVRGLEEAMILTAADFGVTAARLEGLPGIWVGTPRGPEKLGAVGIHLHRWITTHGIAFNVAPDLAHFQWITPCGITDKGVCSLQSHLGDAAPTWDEAADRLEAHLIRVLGLELAQGGRGFEFRRKCRRQAVEVGAAEAIAEEEILEPGGVRLGHEFVSSACRPVLLRRLQRCRLAIDEVAQALRRFRRAGHG